MIEFAAQVRPDDDVLVVSGEVDIAAVDDLFEQARAYIESGPQVLVIDVADVTFIDSSGLGALVRLKTEAAERGKRLVLSNVPRYVARVLDVTGLTEAFEQTDQ